MFCCEGPGPLFVAVRLNLTWLTPGKYGAGVLASMALAIVRSNVVGAVTVTVVVVVVLIGAVAVMLLWLLV